MASQLEAIEIKRKMFFEYEGAPYHCLDVEVSKPTARGGQTLVRLKMRNLLTRAVFDKTFKAGDKFKEPDLARGRQPIYQYADGDGFHFMDQESFETLTLGREMVGDDGELLVDNLIVQINKFNGNPIGLQLPPLVEMTITERTGHARRHGQRQRHQGRHARNRPGDPGAAVHQGRREGEGAHRDARVRRPCVGDRDGAARRGPRRDGVRRRSRGADGDAIQQADRSVAAHRDGTRLCFARASRRARDRS